MSKKSVKNKLIRTIYARKKAIESWTDTLETLNIPIIGLTPASPHIFDLITSKKSEELTVMIDIEINSTTLLIGKSSKSLISHKLPFGSSLYVSDKNQDLSNSYFSRVLNSINFIISDDNESMPSNIYIVGQGLDNLIKNNMKIPKTFKRVSDMNLVDYSYTPKGMEIHELVSQSIASTIDSLSYVTSSCL